MDKFVTVRRYRSADRDAVVTSDLVDLLEALIRESRYAELMLHITEH